MIGAPLPGSAGRHAPADAWLRAVIECTPEALVVTNAEGRIILVNARTEEVFGYGRDEMMGQSVEMLVPERFRAEHARYRRAFLENPSARPMGAGRDLSGRRKDGSEFPIEIGLNPVLTDEGAAVLASIVDITVRKRAERETARRLALADLLESLARIASAAETPRAALERALDRICDHGGWSLGRVVTFSAGRAGGVPWSTHSHSEDPARFAEFIRVSNETAYVPGRGSFLGRVLDEKRAVWIADLRPLSDAPRIGPAVAAGLRSALGCPLIVDDQVAACLELFSEDARDPDELLMRAVNSIASQLARFIERERMHEQAVRLAAIVEVAQDGILTIAPDATIITWNKAAENILGYSAAEAIGRNYRDLIPDDRRAEFEARRQLALTGGFPRPVDSERLARDGRRVPLSVIASPIREADGTVGAIAIMFRDITERSRLERERDRAGELLREKNEDLKGFAYTVSHDLKAPLRGIVGYAQELERRHAGGLSDRARFCVQQVITAARNLDRLIEDLLRYTRLEAEAASATEVDVPRLVRTILNDRSHVVAERGIEVTVEIPFTTVRAWERGLSQVLGNLIDNAINYSREAKPPRLQIRGEESGKTWRLSVADNGIGFDMKYHDRIFGLFNRLVRAEDYQGTGAGLAIAKKLVEKQNGRIRAQSAPGKGATFTVELPKP